MRWALLVLAVGCGRWNFDARDDATARDSGASCSVIAASTGRQQGCAVDTQGNTYCFGVNEFGETQPGGPLNVATPARVVLPLPAVEVSGGRNFSCARLEDGNVWCWGRGDQGQRGDGSNAMTAGPSPVQLGAERAVALVSGAATSCIIRASDRGVMCWGDGQFFVLGQSTQTDSNVPLLIPNTAGTQNLAMGHRHACLIDAAGQAKCWGRGDRGQLSLSDGMNYAAPQLVAAGLAADVSASGSATCLVEQNGDVRCWGENVFGQLGLGDFVPHAGVSTPILSGAKRVAAQIQGGCAVLVDNTLSCWGSSMPDRELVPAPRRVPELANVTEMLAGFYHMCALHDGTLSCWGANENGQLGRATSGLVDAPHPVMTNVASLALGGYHACAVQAGNLFCWGANEYGQLGDQTLAATATPTQINPGFATVEGVSVGNNFTCAWGGGQASCWGHNGNGRIGIPQTASRRTMTPTLVSGLASVTKLALGGGHVCAVEGTQLQCWGFNSDGQLGDGTRTNRAARQAVAGIASPTEIALGRYHTCVLMAGSVKCWGNNSDGALGIGSLMDSLTPADVTLPGTPNHIAAGEFTTCATLTTGELYCWGRNGSGELGIGNNVDQNVPTRVPLPGPVVGITAGDSGACAKLATGEVYCWGAGFLLDTVPDNVSNVPVLLPTLTGAGQIHRSFSAGCTITNGALECWGTPLVAADAQLADSLLRPAPVAIPACP